MVMNREVCPEGVQNKCPGRGGGGVWCRGFMSWGDTLILLLVISRGVQLYIGIAHCLWDILLLCMLSSLKMLF